ncbi:MAG TPA: acetyl-CoA carboxylase biotin carboxyl carrier protein [Candidatus Brocadiia bacterium]|nr:acetyl-CoA carboxylase biotin carboxyl carrier protein [Planctomycetota bacterium]MDO8094896.1 acetyl-CoA carboxylase biotin carboxyl carrier protein [Candidatus Brocadiales bacterium]
MQIIDKVKQLVALMNENNLTEIEIQEDSTKICIRKSNGSYQHSITSLQKLEESTPLPVTSSYGQEGSSQFQLPKKAENCVEITAPMVGTFYRASSPGAEPYVDVGSVVDQETVVCVIEAMKIINEVKAEIDGEIIEVLVEDGRAVEFGQPLFRVNVLTPSAT